jgi:hypothetical protein
MADNGSASLCKFCGLIILPQPMEIDESHAEEMKIFREKMEKYEIEKSQKQQISSSSIEQLSMELSTTKNDKVPTCGAAELLDVENNTENGIAEKNEASTTLNNSSLNNKQQRLLLLRHSSKCHHMNGGCPITQYCWEMKELWKHIITCSNFPDCHFTHCVSSRAVLHHYTNCNDQDCVICGPVRDAIERNSERRAETKKRSLEL